MADRKSELSIAIQKPTGKTNLGDETEQLLRAGGLQFSLPARKDNAPTNITALRIVMMRNGNLTREVANGGVSVGIVGSDKFEEYPDSQATIVVKRLGYSTCTVQLGVSNDFEYTDPKDLLGQIIATSYPKGTGRWLSKYNLPSVIWEVDDGIKPSDKVLIRPYEGGSEDVVERGKAVACVEVVSSGASMDVNRITPVKEVIKSEALLIANRGLRNLALPNSQEIMWNLFRVVMTGLWKTQYRLMKFNYPGSKEDTVLKRLPTRKAPTITQLRDQREEEAWFAAETLVPKSKKLDLKKRLLRQGAQDIFFQELEELVPNLDDPDVSRMMTRVYGHKWRLPDPVYGILV